MKKHSLICPVVTALVLTLAFGATPTGTAAANEDVRAASWLLGQAQQKLLDGQDNLRPFMASRGTTTYSNLITAYLGGDQVELSDAADDFRDVLDLPGFELAAQDGLGESVCWRLRGQALVGNDALIAALRDRYVDVDATLQDEIDGLDVALAAYAGGVGVFPDLIDCPECFDTGACLDSDPECYCSGYEARAVLVDLLARQANARAEKADRQFADGATDFGRRRDAEAEIRRAVQEGYLGAVVLGASMDADQITRSNMSRLRTTVARLRGDFDDIASGLAPGGFSRGYVPFKPFDDPTAEGLGECNEANSLYIYARGAVEAYLAKEADVNVLARACDAAVDGFEDELEFIQGDIVDELGGMCGFGVFEGEYTECFPTPGPDCDESLGDGARMEQFVAACVAGNGELAQAVAANAEAKAALDTAFTELQNIPEKIQIEQDRVGAIATVMTDTADDIGAREIAKGFANAFSVSVEIKFPVPGVTVNFDPGSIVSGFLDAEIEMLRAMQEVQINQIELATTIKYFLIEMAERAKALREYELRVEQSRLQVEHLVGRARIQVDQYRRSLSGLQRWQDPSYRIEMDQSLQVANRYLRDAQKWTFLATQALGYDWARTFSGSEAAKESGSCLTFSDATAWTVSRVIHGDDLVAFFDCATWYWNSYNMGLGYTNHQQTPATISVRQDILGFADSNFCTGDVPAQVRQENIRLFREFLREHTDPQTGWIQFEFATTIADDSLFDIALTGCDNGNPIPYANAKIHQVGCNFVGSGIQGSQFNFAEFGQASLTVGGMSTVRDYAAEPCLKNECLGNPDYMQDDILLHYDLDTIQENAALRTAALEAFVDGSYRDGNGDPTGEAQRRNDSLARLSVGAERWKIEINKGSTQNQWIDFDALEDIELKVWWWYGQPPEYTCLDGTLGVVP